ncbi:DNA ligase 1-like [Heterodontus francisci]|uniref:DNA ligase 1-like n=1 Tax=Heterodontus francisci TaxID=7792 RepID=UPI00355BF5FF
MMEVNTRAENQEEEGLEHSVESSTKRPKIEENGRSSEEEEDLATKVKVQSSLANQQNECESEEEQETEDKMGEAENSGVDSEADGKNVKMEEDEGIPETGNVVKCEEPEVEQEAENEPEDNPGKRSGKRSNTKKKETGCDGDAKTASKLAEKCRQSINNFFVPRKSSATAEEQCKETAVEKGMQEGNSSETATKPTNSRFFNASKQSPGSETVCVYNPSKPAYHPVTDACWSQGQRVPYLAVAQTFEKIEEETARLKNIETLSNLYRSVIALTPADLLPCIYLCLNQLGPAYQGLELGVGETILMKAVAQATGEAWGCSREKVMESFGEIYSIPEEPVWQRAVIPLLLVTEGSSGELHCEVKIEKKPHKSSNLQCQQIQGSFGTGWSEDCRPSQIQGSFGTGWSEDCRPSQIQGSLCTGRSEDSRPSQIQGSLGTGRSEDGRPSQIQGSLCTGRSEDSRPSQIQGSLCTGE